MFFFTKNCEETRIHISIFVTCLYILYCILLVFLLLDIKNGLTQFCCLAADFFFKMLKVFEKLFWILWQLFESSNWFCNWLNSVSLSLHSHTWATICVFVGRRSLKALRRTWDEYCKERMKGAATSSRPSWDLSCIHRFQEF